QCHRGGRRHSFYATDRARRAKALLAERRDCRTRRSGRHRPADAGLRQTTVSTRRSPGRDLAPTSAGRRESLSQAVPGTVFVGRPEGALRSSPTILRPLRGRVVFVVLSQGYRRPALRDSLTPGYVLATLRVASG